MIKNSLTELKKLGLKVTPQRHAILNILDGNTTHPSAETIYKELLKKFPTVSFATVYNTLSRLVEAKKVQELNIDPDKKRFDPNTNPHYHFYCKVCGNVFDLGNDVHPLLDMIALDIRKQNGHQIDTIQINLKGICDTCRKTKP